MSGHTILITGTSSGLGKLAATTLLARGHTVICGMRGGQGRLTSVFAEELRKYPERLFAIDLHLDQPETFSRASDLVRSRFGGKLDVLINNAGTGLFGALEDQTAAQLRYQFEVNFFGVALLIQELLPALRSSRGRVINIGSLAGQITLPMYGAYCASKQALEALTEALYYDLAPLGVQVCIVEPGGLKTDFFKNLNQLFGSRLGPSSPYFERSEGLKRFFSRTVPRLPGPEGVVKKLIQLTERERIPVRVATGLEAFAVGFAKKLLPDFVRVWILRNIAPKVFFRK